MMIKLQVTCRYYASPSPLLLLRLLRWQQLFVLVVAAIALAVTVGQREKEER